MDLKPQEAGFPFCCGPSDPGKLVTALPILQTCKLRAAHRVPSDLIPDTAGLNLPLPSAETARARAGCHALTHFLPPRETQGGGHQALGAAGLGSSPDSAARRPCVALGSSCDISWEPHTQTRLLTSLGAEWATHQHQHGGVNGHPIQRLLEWRTRFQEGSGALACSLRLSSPRLCLPLSEGLRPAPRSSGGPRGPPPVRDPRAAIGTGAGPWLARLCLPHAQAGSRGLLAVGPHSQVPGGRDKLPSCWKGPE